MFIVRPDFIIGFMNPSILDELVESNSEPGKQRAVAAASTRKEMILGER